MDESGKVKPFMLWAIPFVLRVLHFKHPSAIMMTRKR